MSTLFIGRGEIDYHAPGLDFDNIRYLASNSTVYSPGVGLDYNLTHNIAVKADAQFQRWENTRDPLRCPLSMAITLGGVYNFDFNPHHRHRW